MHDVVTHFCRCWRSFFFQCEALLTLGALFVNIAVGQRLHLHVIRCDASHGPTTAPISRCWAPAAMQRPERIAAPNTRRVSWARENGQSVPSEPVQAG